MPSRWLASPDDLAATLRRLDPPIFARISREAVLLDFRTILPGEDAIVERSIAAIFNAS